jgi:hypothetical protein
MIETVRDPNAASPARSGYNRSRTLTVRVEFDSCADVAPSSRLRSESCFR